MLVATGIACEGPRNLNFRAAALRAFVAATCGIVRASCIDCVVDARWTALFRRGVCALVLVGSTAAHEPAADFLRPQALVLEHVTHGIGEDEARA